MYRYRVRPGYGSTELLIEFQLKSAHQAFFDELLKVLKQLNGKVSNVSDVWMNDEVSLHFDSDAGPFLVSKDIWDFVWIMAPKNQNAILKIEEALRTYAQFQQEFVDFEEYKKVPGNH